MREAGNNVRITSQLVDSVNDRQIWGEKFKGTLEDIFDIQEEVSQAIVSKLDLKLTAAEEERLGCCDIEDTQAYEFFYSCQTGNEWLDKRWYCSRRRVP